MITPQAHSSETVPRTVGIGIDIGGTKIAAGLVSEQGEILHRLQIPTPARSAVAVEEAILEAVRRLTPHIPDGHELLGTGVGAAGWMDTTNSTVLFSPHLAWRNEPLRERLESVLEMPVIVLNDADAAAVAESRFGAGRGEEHMVMITLGTGIGGALVLEGRLHRGRWGVAGEFGHQIIMPFGHVCECGNRGCWEQYASGNALGRMGQELVEKRSPLAQQLIDTADGAPVTGHLVTELARSGDRLCQELLEEVGQWLGLGLANLSAALDPGRFVIGGGLSSAGELFLKSARETYSKNLTGRGYRPEAQIVLAELGPDAGLVGAAESVRAAAQR